MRTLTDHEMNMIAAGLRSVAQGCKDAQKQLAVHAKPDSASHFQTQAKEAEALAILFDRMPRVSVES